MTTRDWKYFLISWAIVALCALPAIVWGQSLTVGKDDGNVYSLHACNTEEQAREIITNVNPAERYTYYSRILHEGEPICGVVQGNVTPLRVILKRTVGEQVISIIEFTIEGYPRPLYGIVSFEIKDGSRV